MAFENNGAVAIFSLLSIENLAQPITRNVSGVIIDELMQRLILNRHNKLRNELALNGTSLFHQPQQHT